MSGPYDSAHIPGYDPTADQLQVICWCGATVRWVPRVDVAAGRTESCGTLECAPGAEPRREGP